MFNRIPLKVFKINKIRGKSTNSMFIVVKLHYLKVARNKVFFFIINE